MSNLNAIERWSAIAARAAERYAANPAVAAVLVAGSVARGLADELSDIELDVYWRRPPTDNERAAAVEGAGWERVYAEEDEHEWADGYRIEGVKLDTSGFLVSTIDACLSAALDRADTDPELQVRITALLHGQPLHGEDVIDQWRVRCSRYPTSLALAMVVKGLTLRPRERLDMLAARDDVLLLHRDLVDNLQGLMDALFGLNHVFAPHPFHKWLEWEASLISLKPVDLVPRIRRLLVASAGGAVDEMTAPSSKRRLNSLRPICRNSPSHPCDRPSRSDGRLESSGRHPLVLRRRQASLDEPFRFFPRPLQAFAVPLPRFARED